MGIRTPGEDGGRGLRAIAPEREIPGLHRYREVWQAGPIDFFGKEYGLPGAISGHNGYYLRGPEDCTGQVVISAGGSEEHVREDDLPVYVCWGPRASMQGLWPQARYYD